MAKRKNREFLDAAGKNKFAYQMYIDRLTEFAITVFEWENLPETIDPRFMEMCLFEDGKVILFKDEVLGYLALKCAAGTQLDVYGYPIDRHAYALNGYFIDLTPENSVIMYNNMLKSPSWDIVEYYAQRLWQIDRVIDVNIAAQKTPILLQCDESQRLTLKNVYMQYDGNEPVIYADKGLNPNGLKVLQTGAPFVAEDLYSVRKQIWTDALTTLGVENNGIEKRERLLKNEALQGATISIAAAYSRSTMREKGAAEFNRMFGLDIKPVYRGSISSELFEEEKELEENGEEEGVFDE